MSEHVSFLFRHYEWPTCSMLPSLDPIARRTDCRVRTYAPASSGDLQQKLARVHAIIFDLPHIRLRDNFHEADASPIQIDMKGRTPRLKSRLRGILLQLNLFYADWNGIPL